jgi:hypothetical protein
MIGRLPSLLVLAVLFVAPALADDLGTLPPPLCAPKTWNDVETWRDWASHTPPDTRGWAEEQRRFANSRDVWRWLDRLYIAYEGGKVVTLADCPFTDSLYRYLYDRYDEIGEFHIVREIYYEDRLFTLVMRRTGRLFSIPAPPVWSPDKTRFAYAACDLMNGKDDLAIMKPTGQGRLKTEFETKIPCGLGDCRIAWEGPTVLTATCPRSGDQGNERRAVRLTLSAGAWRAEPAR